MASSPFDVNTTISLTSLSDDLWTTSTSEERPIRTIGSERGSHFRVDQPAQSSAQGSPLLGRSEAIREVLATAQRAAAGDTPVLLEGELGVGKEEIARLIHRKGRRASGPFIHVVCGSIPENLLDARLFGSTDRGPIGEAIQGLLATARGGTLFLDDIQDLPTWAQVKLARALREESSLSPMERGTPAATIRMLVGSKEGLDALVGEGRFDQGLFYSLNVIRIRIPPLRERREDVRSLAESFLAGVVHNTAGARRFSEEAWKLLLAHDWPGNAIELAGLVARAAVMADEEEISAESVARLMSRTSHRYAGDTISVPLGQGLREIERCVVRETIRRCGGNKAAAARTLGLPRRTLYRLLDTKTKSRRRGASNPPPAAGDAPTSPQ